MPLLLHIQPCQPGNLPHLMGWWVSCGSRMSAVFRMPLPTSAPPFKVSQLDRPPCPSITDVAPTHKPLPQTFLAWYFYTFKSSNSLTADTHHMARSCPSTTLLFRRVLTEGNNNILYVARYIQIIETTLIQIKLQNTLRYELKNGNTNTEEPTFDPCRYWGCAFGCLSLWNSWENGNTVRTNLNKKG